MAELDRKKKDGGGEDGSLIKAFQEYLSKLLSVQGLKVLLLDKETTGMTALVYSLSESIAKEVVLVERVDAEQKTPKPDSKEPEKKQEMHHLKAVVYIRPTASSLETLIKHLKRPKYREYYICFSNVVAPEQLSAIAEADEFEVIRSVTEYYADFFAYDPFLFSSNLPFTKSLYQPPAYWASKERELFERNLQCIVGSFLSLKTAPLIRYSKSSDLAKTMAVTIQRRMSEDAELFHFEKEKKEPPLLLIVDRRDDPVTPLLLQWTYQAMVHELIGIKDNRVDLSQVKGIRPDLQEVVLSSVQDKFYKKSMYLNYGDLGVEIKALVGKYQQKSKSTSKLDTVEDMQRFVDQYPEFKELGNNVSKHVALVTEISRHVSDRQLMKISELEQHLAVEDDHTSALDNMLTYMEDQKLHFEDKLRLVLLYALRYENQKDHIIQFKKILNSRAQQLGAKEQKLCEAIDLLLVHAGQSVRGGDLFGTKTLTGKVGGILSGLKGVDNIYTRHRPKIAAQLDALLKGKGLDLVSYPFVEGGQKSSRYKKIFVFMIGGVTYGEAQAIKQLNDSEPGVRIYLGGSHIHNSQSFIADLLGLESPSFSSLSSVKEA